MRKTVALTLLVSLATGCQRVETQGQQDRIESLRCWYLRDQHVTPDDLDFIRKRSKAGDLVCRQILGHMNERGIGMPVNLAEARAIYLSVAAVHSAAYIELARMAEQGVGEPVDFTRARALYAQAGVQEGSGAGAVGLARLLEEGKGGPQDPDAALALYLSGMKRYRDPAWLGIQRLRAQGAVLSEEQALKCNTLWFAALRGALAGVDFDLKRKLSRQMDLGSSKQTIALQFVFAVGAAAPVVTVIEGTGNSAIDDAVLKAVSEHEFPADPILLDGQTTWQITPRFTLVP